MPYNNADPTRPEQSTVPVAGFVSPLSQSFQPFQRDSRDMSTHFFSLKYVFPIFSRKIILFTIHLLGRPLKQNKKNYRDCIRK